MNIVHPGKPRAFHEGRVPISIRHIPQTLTNPGIPHRRLRTALALRHFGELAQIADKKRKCRITQLRSEIGHELAELHRMPFGLFGIPGI